MNHFQLDARLSNDTHLVGDLALCRVLLMNDARYPWVILVPRRPAAREIHRLPTADRLVLLEECCQVSELLERLFQPEKINVAALGNLVSQLHVHHVARYRDDPAWPGPVWGHTPAVAYTPEASVSRIAMVRSGLAL